MLRHLSSLCVFCELKTTSTPSWQHARSMATMRKSRRPSRMELSSTVAKPSWARKPDGKKGPEREKSTPFSGMNQSEARLPSTPSYRARAQGEYLSGRPPKSSDRERPGKQDNDRGAYRRDDRDDRFPGRGVKSGRFSNDRAKNDFDSEKPRRDFKSERFSDRDFKRERTPASDFKSGKPSGERERRNDSERDAFSEYEERSFKPKDKRAAAKREKEFKEPVRERRGGRMRDVKSRPERSYEKPAYEESEGRERPSYNKSKNSPWAGMNQTEARVRGAPSQRSQAELKRSTRGKETTKTEGGYKALKMQQSLSSISYGARTAVKNRISTVEGFESFELLPSVYESISPQALKSLGDIEPTPIQKLAIPALLGHQDKKRRRATEEPSTKGMEQFLLAAETGSGKTLAYLLPAIDALKRTEAIEMERMKQEEDVKEEKKDTNLFELEAPPVHTPHHTTGRPSVIILVPTAELVDQVGELAKSMSHVIKFRAALISSAYSGVVVRNRLFSPSGIDLLVSTPHLLASITKADPNVLSRVSHLIIDEADSLFDRSFSPMTSEILDRATPSLKQLVLCSATIPKRLDSYLRERFPDIRRLATPNLHAIPRRVQLGIVDVEKEPYQGNKDLACADTIWSIGKSAAEHTDDVDEQAEWARTKRIIVFVNEREKTIELTDYLVSKGIDAIALNRDVDLRKQGEILSAFTAGAEDREKEKDKDGMNRKEARKQGIKQLPNTKVLVVTDLASRGIDTTAVRHVVLYDVPHTTIDFIHRLGRTGRMGRRGRGIVLVGKGDRKDVVKEVREGMFKGQALI
jgi:ATP-dependent RNA helicase MRH4